MLARVQLATALVIAQCLPCRAGYEFSLSASSTEPFQNTAPPAGGVRNIYLWATCIDDGISVFEGNLASNGAAVYAFNPLNGVMNVGGATALLLAVPGCPYGNPVNFLLGYWVINDTGVDLCMQVSGNEVLGAVDCDAQNPTLTNNVVVKGFKSLGGSPCTLGTASCSPPEGAGSGSFGT
jgi:hypothetical protein